MMKTIFENWRKFLKEEEEPNEEMPPNELTPKKKTSGQIFNPTRGEKMQFSPEADPDLKYELYDLISNAYREIGGHAKVTNPESVTADKDWNFWVGVDIHNDPDFDLIFFGSKTPFGIKFTGVGHDGTGEAKELYKKIRVKDLNLDGHYVEASGRSARTFIKAGAPIINDQKTVEKVLGKPVKWLGKNEEDPFALGDGWYVRKIAGHDHAKVMLGKPTI